MLKYLLIQLCDSSPSFCHYPDGSNNRPKLIPLDDLNKGIIWALKRNLAIQYIRPAYQLPEEYEKAIAVCEHYDIAPIRTAKDNDICVAEFPTDGKFIDGRVVTTRMSIDTIIGSTDLIAEWLMRAKRLNIAITDYECLNKTREEAYRETLEKLAELTIEEFRNGHEVSCNLLTDRMSLRSMNNCNAGIESVTLAPDGKLYICPAFYTSRESIGLPDKDLNIENARLLTIQYAPVCRICDSFHCRRCVWLNRRHTLELNTPGHEQCVASHIERNISARAARRLADIGLFPVERVFEESACLDPFYKLPRIFLK